MMQAAADALVGMAGELDISLREAHAACRRGQRPSSPRRKRKIPIHKATASQLAALALILGWGGQHDAVTGPQFGGGRASGL